MEFLVKKSVSQSVGRADDDDDDDDDDEEVDGGGVGGEHDDYGQR